jgi:enterochelin esterase family protein
MSETQDVSGAPDPRVPGRQRERSFPGVPRPRIMTGTLFLEQMPPMKKMLMFVAGSMVCAAFATLSAQQPSPAPAAATRKPGDYPLGPDSLKQPGVPEGRLEGPFEWRSQIIANTVRRYWVYVPAQYVAGTPANVLVFQDGARAINPAGSLRVPQVLENLVHKKDIPVTIGIFITPGQRGDVFPDTIGTGNPNNRAQEYDSLTNAYARMVIEEILPEVGKKYTLTTDPKRRVIGGTSSGAIAAFTTAWHFPDQFANVISYIGSYTSIAYRPATETTPMVPGGDLYPTLIRKNPAIKPIRIFLQDGSADLDNNHGNWFLANQQMLSAFNYANRTADERKTPGPRYDVKHEWGDGAHSDAHGGSILPDVLRWIFRDSPK